MEHSDLIKILDYEMKEEQYYLGVFQKEVAFFWSSISAIIGGVLVGLFKSTLWEHYLYLIAAPLMLFVLTIFMKYSLYRTYRRFIEVIATRAKIESILGFNSLTLADDSPYWAGESLTASRHIMHRSSYSTSEDFINKASRKGLYEVYSNIIIATRIGCLFLFCLLLSFAYFKYKST